VAAKTTLRPQASLGGFLVIRRVKRIEPTEQPTDKQDKLGHPQRLKFGEVGPHPLRTHGVEGGRGGDWAVVKGLEAFLNKTES